MEQCLAHGECCLHQSFFLLQVFALSLLQQMVRGRSPGREGVSPEDTVRATTVLSLDPKSRAQSCVFQAPCRSLELVQPLG